MSIRDVLRDKPIVGIGAAIVIVAIAGWLLLGRSRGDKPAGRWYHDLTTGELVQFASQGKPPPVILPSGHEGVLAHVYGCGDCTMDTFVAYLEKNVDQSSTSSGPMTGNSTRMVAAAPAKGATDIQWHPAHSSAGMSIQAVTGRSCLTGTPHECNP